MSERPNIYLAAPNQNWIHAALVSRLMQWMVSGKYSWRLNFKYATPHHRVRNALHKDFMRFDADYHFTHALWVDSDTIPPPDALDKLMAADKDIICGAVPQWKRWGPQPVAWVKRDGGYLVLPPPEWEGVKKVDVGTLAFCLMKADVLRSMPPGVFYWLENDNWKTDGRSEDTVFFEHAQDAGFETYVDFDVWCSHVKEVDLVDIAKLMSPDRDEILNMFLTKEDVEEEDIK